jgi:hypothetical protein
MAVTDTKVRPEEASQTPSGSSTTPSLEPDFNRAGPSTRSFSPNLTWSRARGRHRYSDYRSMASSPSSPGWSAPRASPSQAGSSAVSPMAGSARGSIHESIGARYRLSRPSIRHSRRGLPRPRPRDRSRESRRSSGTPIGYRRPTSAGQLFTSRSPCFGQFAKLAGHVERVVHYGTGA